MKSKKMIFLVITIFTLIFSALLVNTSEATTFPDLAHEGYDTVKNYTLQDLYRTWEDGERQYCAQAMCIEKTAGDTTGALYVYATIDINPDGNSPTSATITFRTGTNDGAVATSSFNYTNSMLAELAYICAMADIEHDSYSHDKDISWQYKHMFLYYWEQKGLRNSLNNANASMSLPASADDGGLYNTGTGRRVYDAAVEYANAVAAGTNDKTYSARIVVFKGGWKQTSAVLTGKENSIEKTEIKKYISHVEYQNQSTSVARSGYSEADKLNNVLTVMPGTIITYKIEVTTGKSSVTVSDTFDSGGLSVYDRGDFSYSGGTYVATVGKGTTTLTIKLKASENMGSGGTVYTNTATADGKSSSDHVKCQFEEEVTPPVEYTASGNYKKYIIAVNGSSTGIGDRSGYDNNTAKANPVTVKKGDTVTYRLEVTNTSDVDIDNLIITDVMEDGLSYGGSRSFTYNFGSINAGSDPVYVDRTVTVTKSNMYLYPLENSFTVTSGTYEERHEQTHTFYWYWMGILYSYSWTEVWYTTENIDPSWFSSNANKDYVQLDDVEIAGKVWLDKDKSGLINRENGISGVTVKLINRADNSVVNTVTTNSSGNYTFGKVQKGTKLYTGGTRKYADGSNFMQYVVQFEYNGVTYEQTTNSGTSRLNSDGSMKTNYQIDSNAGEVDRTGFNNSFETIAYNKAIAGPNGTETSKALEYTKNGHTSTLKSNASTTITAKSFNLFYTTTGETEYLKYINLGLFTRDTADLSLKKDVVKADVSINGYSATYNYGTGPKGTYKLSTPYVLNIYESDYNFRTSAYGGEISGLKGNASNDLNIVLTYKVTIKNESPNNLYAVVREIIDVSTNSMTLNSVVAEDGTTLSASSTSKYNTSNKYTYSGYQTHFLTGLNKVLAKGEETSVLLTYTVNKSSGAIILGTKANFAEIGAFSIYKDASGSTPAGTVDKDSNPGVVNKDVVTNIEKDDKYEDNSYYTSIIIQLRPDSEPSDPDVPDVPTPNSNGGYDADRLIKGNVWEDLNTKTLSNGQKVGDGKKSGENGAKNVTAVLLEVIENGGNTYLVDTGITAKTNTNGDYVLRGMPAGKYIVRFVYGNNGSELVSSNEGHTIRYSGQDYKSTVYTSVGTVNETEVLEATAFAKTKSDKNAQVSVAKDSELRRLEVINYSTTINYPVDAILKGSNLTELAANTSMFADTKKFNMQIEYIGNSGITLNGTHETASGLVVYKHIASEVNFGLIERPITKLELMDDIKEIIAITSAGEELIHIYFDIDYNVVGDRVERTIKVNEVLSKGFENVQLLDKSDSTRGFRYVNVDSEILQGMKITIKYQFAVANIGDVDSSNQNLINMVKNYDVGKVINNLNNSIPNSLHKYGTGSGLSSKVLSNYSYENMTKAIDENIGTYKTIVNGTANNKDYELGYFLGNTYYNGTYQSTTDKDVETRVDQIISYVDNDLIFIPEENLTDNGSPKFQAYAPAEIESKGLLKDITAANAREKLVDSSGVSYITDSKNNLAFNIEDATVNGNLYKFLPTITNKADGIYMINLNASRILASESDLDDVAIDNLAEIVKMTNTVGRKTYIEMSNSEVAKTGVVGNSPEALPHEDGFTPRELDTNYTETVTFSPPTGLSVADQKIENANTITKIVASTLIVALAVSGTIYFIKKKKFYT